MMLLKNTNFKGKIKRIFLFEIVIFIILIWIYDQNNYSFGSYLEKKINYESLFNACFKRSLAKHGTQKNVKYQKQRQKLYDDKINKIIKDDAKNYEYLKKRLNDLDSYKKNYKRRHDKKKGLARLDCYYEKKIFDKIGYVEELAKRMLNEKKTYKKYIYSKFAIRFIIFALFTIHGILISILFADQKKNGNRRVWTSRSCKDMNKNCTLGYIHFSDGQINAISNFYCIISCILLMIVMLVIIYTFIKIIKYEKLKAGNGKMDMKNYYRFCKDVLNNKIS